MEHDPNGATSISSPSSSSTSSNVNDEIMGFDVEFAEQISSRGSITCNICLFILNEPFQAVPCGHRFCKNCIEKYKK